MADHNLLPDWNDLSNECRVAMCKAAEYNSPGGWFDDGQCALDVYLALRKHMPQQPFPLFQTADLSASPSPGQEGTP